MDVQVGPDLLRFSGRSCVTSLDNGTPCRCFKVTLLYFQIFQNEIFISLELEAQASIYRF